MPQISHADINTYLDACCDFYVKLLGTQASTYGMGPNGAAWGAAGAVADLKQLMLDMTDAVVINDLIHAIVQLDTQIGAKEAAAAYLAPLLSALQLHTAKQQLPNVRTLDEYLLYYNTGAGAGTWNVLQSHQMYDLLGAWNGGLFPSPSNLYFEVLQGATYPDALGEYTLAGDTFTQGVTIDSTKYAGGFPFVKASGIAGGLNIVTVTGTAFDPATNAIAPGVTWTASFAGDGTYALAPDSAPADSLIIATEDVASGHSAGTYYVEAHRPSGRPLIQ